MVRVNFAGSGLKWGPRGGAGDGAKKSEPEWGRPD